MEESKTYLNKDLNTSEKVFKESITNDFIGTDFIEQLEWAMLMIQQNFKQMRLADHLKPVTRNHFDKAVLMSASLNPEQKFFKPLCELQVTPDIFPLLNVKLMIIAETISLQKVKELDFSAKRPLKATHSYVYEHSMAFYNKQTESFYGQSSGWQLNKSFFKHQEDEKFKLEQMPVPISLIPGYSTANLKDYITKNKGALEHTAEAIKTISMAYQLAMSLYYEWTIYIKEYDNVGFIIPIEPQILSELYKTSMLKFENKKKMLQFVKEHYRRKVANPNEDYSVFVNRYLRGEKKFEYNGFYTEIIPTKYDLNRVKTKKKFVDIYN